MAIDTPYREHPTTYVVLDQSNQEEHKRIQLQDRMLTDMMGGVLGEQPDPTVFRTVLDVGCGYGHWLVETAKTYPTMARLVGVDINEKMIAYARALAIAQGVADRVEFHVMDALGVLDFPDNSFDLINQRLGTSYLRIWEWTDILQKYQRVCKPQGVIRITECNSPQGNSPAFSRLCDILSITLSTAGHLKTTQVGPIELLPLLLGQQGFRQVQMHIHALSYPAGTREGTLFVEDMKYAFRTFVPFLRKWTRLPEDYETLYQQMLSEIQQPSFVATWNLLTIWGNPPSTKARTRNRYQ